MERNIKRFFVYIYIYHFIVIAETNTALKVNCTSIKIFCKTLYSLFHLPFIICLRLDYKDKIQIQHRVMFRHQVGYFSCLRQRNLFRSQVPCGGTPFLFILYKQKKKLNQTLSVAKETVSSFKSRGKHVSSPDLLAHCKLVPMILSKWFVKQQGPAVLSMDGNCTWKNKSGTNR